MNTPTDILQQLIRDVPDFPKPGILFKDITPLLASPTGRRTALDLLSEPFGKDGITAVAGMESRGFIFGVPVAERLDAGFVPIRKPGKLPCATSSESFALEYGTDTLEIHKDALTSADRVLVVDDLLATGGTAAAAIRLVQGLGAQVAGLAFVIELDFLHGRTQLPDGIPIHSLLHY